MSVLHNDDDLPSDLAADASPRYAQGFAPYWVGVLVVAGPFIALIGMAIWACWK